MGMKQSLMQKMLKKKSQTLKVMVPVGVIALEQKWKEGKGSPLCPIPDITETGVDEIEIYTIKEPFCYARIIYDNNESEFVYQIHEPPMDEKEADILKLVKDTLQRTLEYELDKMAIKDKSEYLKKSVDSYIKSREMRLEPATVRKIHYFIARDFVGYGSIDSMMNDKYIEDISCDGTNVPIFIYHQKYESVKTDVKFEEEADLNSFVIYLGQRCGKQVSVSVPILDGTTTEGHRVQATYGTEVTTRGSSFTIRRFKEKPFTPVELITYNTASLNMVAYAWMLVEHGQSMIIAGGTASGKTATLNALALFIKPGAKVITMEDTREINLPHENWIPGTTRTGVGERDKNGKAAGEIDMFELVRAALRQRPDYIIVGEVRGAETATMFQAMATGHTTYSTMHADSVKSMINRLENPPISTPRILLTSLNFVIIQKHVRVGDSIVRRITQIVELVGFEPETNEVITNMVYEWDQRSDSFIYKGHSFMLDQIMEMKNMTHEEMNAEMKRRVDIIKYMVEKEIVDFRKISNLVVSYYKEPMETIQKIREEMGWIEESSLLMNEGGADIGA
ncbi:MAG: type II/IV secretion system ATPase subunit [Candidatus Thermoplasmatota archaeon]|nr:type II/IV secretion system ATPase subunit [Euryarchaeota archaeon]MBU4031367.1 type II/IV secretion system ATPase subunit [Candidatus Thermoplasmatota archaeon]MBU4071337.1 type II/IV secretion system ATPase subunit [Candidatus Thermoplasmatota archaeon]MBU4143339.1 type II/IV secretion system ATPase subunit [Candidatus Thermoplasmatota archaeon]MBU4592356.1 type II/IV secretion system ATPase subunit [Candidatus Thermoplasmatota archaeon]